MADEASTPEKLTDEEERLLKEQDERIQERTDPYLSMFVGATNGLEEGTSGLEIIFSLRGLIIGGTLISTKRYFEQWAVLTVGQMKTTFQKFADDHAKTVAEFEAEGRRVTPVHFHLEDARVVVAGSTPVKTKLYRGRLDSVDGWTLGVIGATFT
jgi:hypothetical protein